MSDDRNINTVSEWDGVYSNWINEGKLNVRREEMAKTHEAILRLLPQGGYLLDVGCGVGHLLALVAAQIPALALTGVDFSPVAVNLARTAVGNNGAVFLLDFVPQSLPFTDGEYDVVVSSHVVEHLVDPVAHLRELVRVTKPGGRVIVNFPVGDPPYELHLHHELTPEVVYLWLLDAAATDHEVNTEPVILAEPGHPNDNGIVWYDKK